MIAEEPISSDWTGTSGARFSVDRRFRYTLWRRWGADRSVAFLLLNPSIADEDILDPTLRRCHRFAVSWGFGGMDILNVFPLVSTYPEDLLSADDRDGEFGGNENLREIKDAFIRNQFVVLGFGVNVSHPKLRYAAQRLRALIESLQGQGPQWGRACALSLSRDGLPRHPLYLKSTCEPLPYASWPDWTRPQ